MKEEKVAFALSIVALIVSVAVFLLTMKERL